MNKSIKVSARDNALLKLYDYKWREGIELSREEESQYDRLGRKYADSDEWHHRYNRYEDWYYIVQD